MRHYELRMLFHSVEVVGLGILMCLAPGIHCDHAGGFAGEALEELIGDRYGGGAVGSEVLVVPIVEKDVGSAVVAASAL